MTEKLSETVIVRAVAEHAAQRITRKIVRALQQCKETTSGDGTGLETVWDEICVQVQYEESFAWGAYDDTVRSLLAAYVAELPKHEREALWLQTDQGSDWDCEEPEERDDYPVFNDDIVNYLAHEYVYAKAGRWSNRRIEAFLDQSSMRD
ncbi:MAG: hypothetical protein P4L66_15985 [Acetobacteraceae bacterium]|nr:hypothetical protein [Acetobacteraceae bacterium]